MSAPRKRAPRGSTAAASRQSQRERLLGRPRPSLSYRFLVGDPDAARAEVDKARNEGRNALRRLEPESAEYRRAYQAMERRLAKAREAVDACYEQVVLRALPTAGDVTVEKLIAAHPPTAEQMERAKAEREQARQRGEDQPPWPEWNEDTFPVALLAACAESDMSEDDWREFLDTRVSAGERRGLWMAALAINMRERVADPLVLPKGLTGMLS